MSEYLLPQSTIRKFRIVRIESKRQVRSFTFEIGQSTSKATVKDCLTVRNGRGGE
jgi:ribosomal protein S12